MYLFSVSLCRIQAIQISILSLHLASFTYYIWRAFLKPQRASSFSSHILSQSAAAPVSVPSSTDGHLGWFPSLAITTSAAVDNLPRKSLHICKMSPAGWMPHLSFLNATSNVWKYPLPTASPAVPAPSCELSNFGIGLKLVSQGTFSKHLSFAWASFHMFKGHLYFFLCEASVHALLSTFSILLLQMFLTWGLWLSQRISWFR